jgi:hypothetical protein
MVIHGLSHLAYEAGIAMARQKLVNCCGNITSLTEGSSICQFKLMLRCNQHILDDAVLYVDSAPLYGEPHPKIILSQKGPRGSAVVEALCYNRKVAGSTPDEVNFQTFT